ncbi:MAG: hypothetical protein N3B18_04275 [Desulfobacterota bacterium]|nr:hypothetical protein [Thermodesulfobacteriota bacterium]
MTQPFTRADVSKHHAPVVSRGRWGNADILRYEHNGTHWMIKDFSACPAPVRQTWGRWMASRECRVLERLQGIKGIPQDPFMLDPFAFCYRFIPGTNLKIARKQQKIGAEFFLALEDTVREMHKRNIVHLDIRYMRNILVTNAVEPALLDFQSSLFLDSIPRVLHGFLKNIDISGVYKCWRKVSPSTIDDERLRMLEKMERIRSLWILKGYPLGMRGSRR